MNSKSPGINAKTTAETVSSEGKSTDDSTDKIINGSNDCQSSSLVIKQEIKEGVKFKKVESRYKQSAEQWANRRSEDTHKSLNSSQGTSRRGTATRNPTPERKVKKASTPKTSDKTLNCTGLSAINVVNDNKDKGINPDLNFKKYGKGLITGRKSLAPMRLPFDADSKSGKSGPLTTSALENPIRNKEYEESIRRSIYLQSVYLKLRAQVSQTGRNADAFNKISYVWKQSNQIRDQITETQEYVNALKNLIQTIDTVEKQNSYLNQYVTIRAKVDPLFGHLSDLIGCQKSLIRIENCSEDDFSRLNELMESCLKSDGLESFDNSTESMKNIDGLVDDIKSMEAELEECRQDFDKCVQELEKYKRIENVVNPDKELTLRRLF